MNVLAVDDEKASLRLIEGLVQRLGHRVWTARDGGEALRTYEREDVHVVLSDWIMPVLDGPGLCRRIRDISRRDYPYVVLVTVLDGKKNYIEGLDAGADDFISKPFDPDELSARLRVAERILGLRGQVRQLEKLLSICSYCKKIRDGENWQSLERYVSQRTDTDFSHGICPSCYTSLMGTEG